LKNPSLFQNYFRKFSEMISEIRILQIILSINMNLKLKNNP
jgi:hypothetical protein